MGTRLKLQGLECDIRYKQGRENVVADFLSRLPQTNETNKVTEKAKNTRTFTEAVVPVLANSGHNSIIPPFK